MVCYEVYIGTQRQLSFHLIRNKSYKVQRKPTVRA
ncbi:hypothetical protein VPH5P1C_0149 [Vibrio phage 5P1c]